ncbi:DUF6226 family protein [Rhodococcoides fascians]|uniref:DUF6226 family protein n=1 Tax=Rhodococcoides fascians TaxID=1828 RepID=UPI000689934A
MEDPQAEAYGRVTNPERFAPVIEAAESVVADLNCRFDVIVTRGPAPSAKPAIVDLVQITPVRVDQAPLAITFTSFPGLYLDVGAWTHIALPACGCDACEESAEDVLQDLSEYCEALTGGRLSERIVGKFRPTLQHSWNGDGWGRSGRLTLTATRAAELRAGPVQPPTDGSWRPWSLRS